jgi:hypothetical protein
MLNINHLNPAMDIMGALPPPFTGKHVELDRFFAKLNICFKLAKAKFSDEEVKILTALSCFEGDAETWALPLLKGEVSFASFNSFETAVRAYFSDPNHDLMVRRRLDSFYQGQMSSAQYLSEFRALILGGDFSDKSKFNAFYRGLLGDIRMPYQ